MSKTKLKGLRITSTDLVTSGANPDAHIRLFKRKDAHGDGDGVVGDSHPETLLQKAIAALQVVFGKTSSTTEPVTKDATTFDEEMERDRMRGVTSQAWDYTYALSDSLCSIITDGDLTEDEKRDMLFTSLEEFAETLHNAIPNWAAGEKTNGGEVIAKSTEQQAAFDALVAKYAKTADKGATPPTGANSPMPPPQPPESAPTADNGGDNNVGKSQNQKEETRDMKFNKSQMTAEELAALEDFEKKYGIAEPETPPTAPNADGGVAKSAADTNSAPGATLPVGAAAPELHPEVKKALDENKAMAMQLEELRKSLEIKDLTAVAKKYEILGKKADELAPKLYDMKKAGGSTYDSFVALLDEQVNLVEKGGTFGEIGKNTSGGISAGSELDAKAAEIRKANTGMTQAEAFAKAYEENPELAAQYEQAYEGRA